MTPEEEGAIRELFNKKEQELGSGHFWRGVYRLPDGFGCRFLVQGEGDTVGTETSWPELHIVSIDSAFSGRNLTGLIPIQWDGFAVTISLCGVILLIINAFQNQTLNGLGGMGFLLSWLGLSVWLRRGSVIMMIAGGLVLACIVLIVVFFPVSGLCGLFRKP